MVLLCAPCLQLSDTGSPSASAAGSCTEEAVALVRRAALRRHSHDAPFALRRQDRRKGCPIRASILSAQKHRFKQAASSKNVSELRASARQSSFWVAPVLGHGDRWAGLRTSDRATLNSIADIWALGHQREPAKTVLHLRDRVGEGISIHQVPCRRVLRLTPAMC